MNHNDRMNAPAKYTTNKTVKFEDTMGGFGWLISVEKSCQPSPEVRNSMVGPNVLHATVSLPQHNRRMQWLGFRCVLTMIGVGKQLLDH